MESWLGQLHWHKLVRPAPTITRAATGSMPHRIASRSRHRLAARRPAACISRRMRLVFFSSSLPTGRLPPAAGHMHLLSITDRPSITAPIRLAAGGHAASHPVVESPPSAGRIASRLRRQMAAIRMHLVFVVELRRCKQTRSRNRLIQIINIKICDRKLQTYQVRRRGNRSARCIP